MAAEAAYRGDRRSACSECVRPGEEDRLAVGRLIMDELVLGVQTPEQVGLLGGVVGRLQAQGCDAVVLGCTELPLVLHDGNSPLPTLDSTRLLARAAVRKALAHR